MSLDLAVRLAVIAALIVLGGSPFVGAQPKAKAKKADGEKSAREPVINPWHRPEGSIVNQSGRFYVWYEEGTWSIRCTALQGRRFFGTIKVIGDGKIKACLPVGLKDRANKDGFVVNAARKELKFHFQTAQKSDGFDLKVEGEDARLEFDFNVGERRGPALIFIGRDMKHPARNPFTLPLAPPKPAQLK